MATEDMKCMGADEFVTKCRFGELPYKDIRTVYNEKLIITDAELFSNKNGDGVFLKAVDEKNEVFRLCTHAVGIVGYFSKPNVAQALTEGICIKATFYQRNSSTSGRPMVAIKSW